VKQWIGWKNVGKVEGIINKDIPLDEFLRIYEDEYSTDNEIL